MNRFKKGEKFKPIIIDTLPLLSIAFLLLLFLMYINFSTRYKVMNIIMPEEYVSYGTICCGPVSQIATILLDTNHSYYWYNGLGDDPMSPPVLERYNTILELRKRIIAHRQSVVEKIQNGYFTSNIRPAMLIKPSAQSTFVDLVDVVDEMAINKIDFYSITDISETEKLWVNILKNHD